jgi:ribosomal protein S16
MLSMPMRRTGSSKRPSIGAWSTEARAPREEKFIEYSGVQSAHQAATDRESIVTVSLCGF